ncbi:HNH endonuclease signature motif containing protein [Salinibacterium sp. ZJ450]|uniref:HNH endonuclease signature motif containing protein n=1 Tax=Salinibacterium sp. ZJ450 TaxID=2708338 RepID=UPI001423B086|nr:HNH endonuclease signature motif containing protein [Salinibacterium sp. ZJ450]
MAFWWATQTKNYETAIDQGSLWSSETASGVRQASRIALHQLKRGDIVFHYAGQAIRAVSTVAEEWVDAPRPDGYPKKKPDDLDVGWYVKVAPITTGLWLPWQRAAELITHGNRGPLDYRGVTAQKYVSPLSDEDGARLLGELGVVIEPEGDSLYGLPASTWGGDVTDAETVAKVRLEQGELRAHLLDGRTAADCALCGRRLPKGLLIAAHIVPRSLSTEEERRDFGAIAMLACALGCDALFEWGYVVVDETGIIRRGIEAPTEDLAEAVSELDGRPCTAHDPLRAPSYARHLELRLGQRAAA